MNEKQSLFLDHAALFRCPLCRGELRAEGLSLKCGNAHTFDLSRKGYVNFVPGQKPLKYTKDLFLARERVFEQGFYEPAARRIAELIEDYRQAKKQERLVLTDAGCGQGYYSKFLASRRNDLVIGFDLSAEAVMLASGGVHRALFMVSDITNIPVADATQDVVLDILTQANYHEFARILKGGGMVLKVIPGAQYLKEIRDLLKGKLRRDAYSADAVIQHFKEHHSGAAVHSLHYALPLDQRQASDFLKMTPMTLQIGPSQIRAEELDHITIHLLFLTGSPLGEAPQ